MNILYEISQTAARFPDRTVMICKEGRLNYGDLAAVPISWRLPSRDSDKENRTPIPVYGHKSPLMLICFLACVKSGRGYCPIDVSVPWSRTMQIIKNIQPPFVLACEDPEETESADASVSFCRRNFAICLVQIFLCSIECCLCCIPLLYCLIISLFCFINLCFRTSCFCCHDGSFR